MKGKIHEMRSILFATAAVGLGLLSAQAADDKAFREVNAADARRELTGLTQVDSPAAMWIWADRYVYEPGQQLTLRWTLRANNDFYPYMIVAYRQNNQTGAKTYLPGNTSSPTDTSGNSIETGFRIVRLADASKGVLVGAGGSIANAALTIPNEPGMHTFVVQLRDYTGGRVVKAAYAKIGVVTSFVDAPATITADTTWTNDRAYRLRGIVQVAGNATLRIEPGTFVIGQPGSQPPSVLLVTTAGRLIAEGTRSRPIIMTSSQPFGSRQRGDWGGLILLGRSRVNDPGGSLNIEGLPDSPDTRYGGIDEAHNCGSLRYVRIEFAGALLRPNEETNSFTWGACGSNTRSEYLQAHYGLDDSFEWFGGTNDAKYLVGTYGADDYVDVQVGYRGRIQHVVAVANDDLSNRAVEADNYERDFAARPLGRPVMYNMTFVGGGNRGFDEADAPCLYYRRGAGAVTNNTVCFNWTTRGLGGANFDSILPLINSGDFTANGILFWDNGRNVATGTARQNTLTDQVTADYLPFAQGTLGMGRNFIVADPMMRRPLERNDPDFRPLLGSPLLRATWVQPPDDGFFDQWAAWLGAFGEVNWTEEWTTFLQEQDIRP